MSWVRAVADLRTTRTPGVLVTVSAARGHTPRAPGAKMVVTDDETWGSVGGGNLEEVAIRRARELIVGRAVAAESLTLNLSDKAQTEHGRQCCGGEVTLLLEPLPVVPAVAIFGLGHVGRELAHILVRHDIELWLVDSRADAVAAASCSPVVEEPAQPASRNHRNHPNHPATIHTRHAIVPELVLGEVPAGTDVLIMTHDHAEDFALCDAALRCGHLGSIGVIGSDVKWQRFVRNLRAEGLDPDSIRSPIGLPALAGKEPATIALAVAAELVASWQQSVVETP
ncbi:MAG: xanthine dehydrogenase accessory protein XdhC [Nocardioides sp.]